MVSETITISTNVLEWLLEKFNNRLGNDVAYIHKWISGESKPTLKQAFKIWSKLHIPTSYLFLNEKPAEICPIVEFRTINSVELDDPSYDLIETYEYMIQIQNWMRNYCIDNRYDKLDFVGICKNEAKNRIVEIVLNKLSLEKGFGLKEKDADSLYKIIRNCCENIGIIVMQDAIVAGNTRRKLNVKEFRAFSIIDEYAPIIFINSTDSKNGKLFSLLHEIAHIFIGESSLYNLMSYVEYNDVKEVETICNYVAAEILVPNDIFLNFCNARNETDVYEFVGNLAEKFNCSRSVILRKLLTNNFIEMNVYKECNNIIKNEAMKYMENKPNGAPDYYKVLNSKVDKNFIKALNYSVKNGDTLYSEAYRLTHTNSRTYNELVKKVLANG